jgi:hypothetical protein
VIYEVIPAHAGSIAASTFRDQYGDRWWPFQPEGELGHLRCQRCLAREPRDSAEQWWYNASADYVLCPRCKPRINYQQKHCPVCNRWRRLVLFDQRWGVCYRCIRRERRLAHKEGKQFCLACLKIYPRSEFQLDYRGYPKYPVCRTCFAKPEVRLLLFSRIEGENEDDT